MNWFAGLDTGAQRNNILHTFLYDYRSVLEIKYFSVTACIALFSCNQTIIMVCVL